MLGDFFNNISVRQLTILVSSLVALITSLLWLILLKFTIDWRVGLVVVASICISIVVVYYLLQRYVFKRLTIIYQIIRQSRMSTIDAEMSDESEDYTIEAVNQEVVEWARATSDDIKQMKTLETYRKDFVGNISHELKTPIFNMQGYLHTLLDGGLEDDNINRKYVKKAASNLDRLQAIVEDLESISKLEAEDGIVDYSVFDLTELTAEVITSLDYISKNHDCQISHEAGSNKTLMVRADPGMIQQVLVNLLTNAVKYSKSEGGQITINFFDLDRLVLVEITDNGIGIDENHLKHLFDRFYRVDSSRSRQLGGSGLGLSIVKHIIEAHKQTINVRSTPDIGSTFGFTLEKAK